MTARAFLLLAALAGRAWAAEGWLTDLASARAAAKAGGKPILVDFQAVWCYSCYYMEQKVLSRDGFKKAAAGTVLLKLDVDTVEGGELKKRLRVGFLPSYVLMDASEKELGRIIGEQTEADFLAKLAAVLGRSALSPAGAVAAALDANDLEAAQKARDAAPPGDRSGPDWGKASARLDLALAARTERHEDAVDAFIRLMRLGGGCELPYHLSRVEPALDHVPEARRREAFEAARAALAPVVEERWFGRPEDRCADGRSLAESMADVYGSLGLAERRKAFLDAAADELAKRLKAAGGPGNDRNLDDDARVFFAMAGRDAEAESHLRRLVAAYPSDYVYSARLARMLKDRGRVAEALPFSETAYRLSYGANRVDATKLRAEVLVAAGKKEEAKALLRLELKAARRGFKDRAEALAALLKTLGG